MDRTWRTMLVLVLVAMVSRSTWATDGHQLIGIGAVQKSTAGAGVASAKDATWVLLNPAGIVELRGRVDVSLEIFAPDRFMEPHGPGLPDLGGMPLANSFGGRCDDDSVFYIPSAGVIVPLEKGTLGVGIYGVSGMGVDYASSRTTVPMASGENFDRRTEYSVAKAAAAYALPIGEGLAVGAAVNADIAQFRTDMLTPRFSQTAGAWDADYALGAGFQVGITKRFDKLSVGGTYISRQWMEEFGKYDDLFKAPLDLPQMAQVGLAYDLLPELEILLDYKFINWSGVGLLGDAPSEGGFGWDDQHVIKVGAAWTVSERLDVRAGYSHAESPIGKDVVFANALFPAVVEDHVTAGFSLNVTKHTSVHAAYMHAFENKVTDSGGGDMYSMAGAGSIISLAEDSFSFQYTYAF